MAGELHDRDPWEATTAHRGEIVDEPFADRPTASPIGPAGQIQAISLVGRRIPRRFGLARILATTGLVLIVAAMLRSYTGLL